MSTLTDSAPKEDQRVATDLEALARLREERFQARRARIEADAALDPRIKALYLDREIWDNQRCATELGVGATRVSMMRTGIRKRTRERPHPALLPDRDTVEGVRAGHELDGIEAGRIREWAVMRGTHDLNPKNGKLIRREVPTHGRPRAQRPNRSTRFRNPPAGS